MVDISPINSYSSKEPEDINASDPPKKTQQEEHCEKLWGEIKRRFDQAILEKKEQNK